MRTSAERCSICRMLLHAIQHGVNGDCGNIDIKRTRSALRIGANGPRLLRFCMEPGHADNHYPIGRPILPESGNSSRFALLRAWLRQCDNSHDCSKHSSESKEALPTRVLYVGDPKDSSYSSDLVRLVYGSEASRHEYLALSHCWGKVSVEEKERYCTTHANISERLCGFSLSELPKTFQDAVTVTRELGVLYLWIDSLCIIQYWDNHEDWKREAGRMESVFPDAYCTIAATAAADSKAGFLEREIRTEHVYVQDTSGRQFYISTDIDDFDNHVDGALLNTRAWVMQERVLSRRTIHFSANQTYWECGEEVYCENLTVLRSPKTDQFFTLDPNFPNRLLRSGKRRTLNCISFLLKDYSKRHLTYPTDRRVAMSGLEDRIARGLKCRSRYGIFQKYLPRTLLWHASNDKMKKIAYDYHMPSWSWMVYSGGIELLDVTLGTVDWVNHLMFDEECKHALITNALSFKNLATKADGNQYAVLDSDGAKRGWIEYDVGDSEELVEEWCVVVGRTHGFDATGAEEYYILVIRPTGVGNDYRRVGIGLIKSNCVVGPEISVRVV
ncbi:HET-domain-containing protein [Zopfia rhizophila CBS 207.26]|uniref:HET-domain-containing protein n=1 Tax=Zopfia rhizophila CBS 207.26 TaxID=1314779 RepID=A0A6A6DMR2_9PEZI|nr:HET-domain-containing protein [Zopfia rhizophila CBS 207.26]